MNKRQRKRLLAHRRYPILVKNRMRTFYRDGGRIIGADVVVDSFIRVTQQSGLMA